MSHPLESQPLVEGRSESEIEGPSAEAVRIKRNFLAMTTLLAVNHGCTVACLDLANARLGSVGVWQSGALYASYTLSALYGSSYFVKRYGSRNGLVLGMGMSAGYVTSFFVVSSLSSATEGNDGGGGGLMGSMREIVAIASAVIGGVGGSVLWTSQGAYFSSASQLYAAEGGGTAESVTGQFGGNFAFVFLLLEVILRLLSTFAIKLAGLPWEFIFGLYSALAILPVFFMMGVMDPDGKHGNRYGPLGGDSEVLEEDERGSTPLNKATATLDLLRKDAKAWYLSPLSILFGLSTAFCSSVLNGSVISHALKDANSTYVGFYTAITSMVASVASLLFGRLQSSGVGGMRCGKGPIITAGVLAYLTIAMQFVALPDGGDWTRGSLLIVYVFLGIGRAMYEGTLKAVYADFFPEEKEGAFGSIILFGGTASTLGYVLSVTGALRCKAGGGYCVEYNDGSLHNVLVMEVAIIATGIVAIPAFWRAVWAFRKGQATV